MILVEAAYWIERRSVVPAVAMRVDELKVDGDEGRWEFRNESAFGKPLRLGVPHLANVIFTVR